MKSSHRRRLNLVRTYTTVQFCELTTWFALWYCRHKSCTRAKHSVPPGLLLSERAISVLLWKSVWQTDRHNGAMLIMILAHAYPQTCGRTLRCSRIWQRGVMTALPRAACNITKLFELLCSSSHILYC